MSSIADDSAIDLPKNYVVFIEVETNQSIPYIKLNWQLDDSSSKYILKRKLKEEIEWETLIVADTLSEYIDTNISISVGYEYSVQKVFDEERSGWGYVYAGMEIDQTNNKGSLLLLVDNTLFSQIPNELALFRQNLIGAGWQVIQESAPRTERFDSLAVIQTKRIIENAYFRDSSNLKALVLLGRIAVPYSGEFAIDGHFPDHYGAWPADVFYGIFSDVWSDTIANSRSADRKENWNVYHDGKFDQTYILDDVKLKIGRIDFFNLPIFEKSETELIKEYILKNHQFRHNITKFPHRAILKDGFGMYSIEVFAANAWLAYNALIGKNNIDTINIFPTIQTEKYLWIYGCNQGSYNSILSTAYSDDFATKQSNAVFSMFLGSYFPDWDTENNLMRSAIASSPSLLISFFAGRPTWHLHHLALGEPIGYATKLTQNNHFLYESTAKHGFRLVHIALIGDPTLKMYNLNPPTNPDFFTLSLDSNEKMYRIIWNAPQESYIGFNIYRSNSYDSTFVSLNSLPISVLHYTDLSPFQDNTIYQIRTVALQETITGSFINESQGVFVETSSSSIDFSDNKNQKIIITPNPSTDFIELNSEIFKKFDISKSLVIKVYNGLGLCVLSISKATNDGNIKIVLSHLPSGIYYLRIGNVIEKFIKI